MSLSIEIFSFIFRFPFFISFILNFFRLWIEVQKRELVPKNCNMLKELENFVLRMWLYIVLVTSSRINDEREVLLILFFFLIAI